MKDKDSNIELRSEKVRKVIGDIPPALLRWGIVIIIVIVLSLLSAILFISYPYGTGETIFEHWLLKS